MWPEDHDPNVSIAGLSWSYVPVPSLTSQDPHQPWITSDDIRNWSTLPPYIPSKGLSLDQFLKRFGPSPSSTSAPSSTSPSSSNPSSSVITISSNAHAIPHASTLNPLSIDTSRSASQPNSVLASPIHSNSISSHFITSNSSHHIPSPSQSDFTSLSSYVASPTLSNSATTGPSSPTSSTNLLSDTVNNIQALLSNTNMLGTLLPMLSKESMSPVSSSTPDLSQLAFLLSSTLVNSTSNTSQTNLISTNSSCSSVNPHSPTKSTPTLINQVAPARTTNNLIKTVDPSSAGSLTLPNDRTKGPKVFNPYDIKSPDGIPYSIMTLDQHVLFNSLDLRSSKDSNSLSTDEKLLYQKMKSVVESERALFRDFMLRRLQDVRGKLSPVPPMIINYTTNKIRFDLQRRSLFALAFHFKYSWKVDMNPGSAPRARLRYHSSVRGPRNPSELRLESLEEVNIPMSPPQDVMGYWDRTRLPPVSTDEKLLSALRKNPRVTKSPPNVILSAGTLTALARIWTEMITYGGPKTDVMLPMTIHSNIVTLDKPMAPDPGVKLGSRAVYAAYCAAACRATATTRLGEDHADYVMWELIPPPVNRDVSVPGDKNLTTGTDPESIRVLVRSRIDSGSGLRVKVIPEEIPLIMRHLSVNLPTNRVVRYIQAVIRGDFPNKRDVSKMNNGIPEPVVSPRIASLHFDVQTGKVLTCNPIIASDLVDELPSPPECIWGFIHFTLSQLKSIPSGQYLLGFRTGSTDPFVLAAGPESGTGRIDFDLTSERSISLPVIFVPNLDHSQLPPQNESEWVIHDPVGGTNRIPETFPIMPKELRSELKEVLPRTNSSSSSTSSPSHSDSNLLNKKKRNRKRQRDQHKRMKEHDH